jgi:serine/threonine-protein kinase
MTDQVKLVAGVREGDLLAGKYRIERILGAGGMGVVVAARHIHLDERVAIKFLLPEMLSNADAVTRFGREARAAVKIKSEHVARVSDVGTLDNGAPYMVMEYLDGSDLSDWLHQRGALPIDQAVEFLLQAGEAIAEAHTLGIVHRDLKPANLFVVRRSDGTLSVKVLDFGISKVASATGFDMTKTSSVMGSPLYMSPEQMQSTKDTDARSDLWALGVILYELLSADSPFQGNTMPELVARILSAPPEPLRTRRPDAPPALEAVILKCLERDRTRRYQTVGELALALMPFAPKRAKTSVERIYGIMKAAGIPTGTVTFAPSDASELMPQRTPGARTATAASWGRTDSRTGTGKAKLGVAAVVLVVAGLGVAVIAKRGSPAPDGSATTAAPAPLPEHPAATTAPAATAAPAPAPPASAEPQITLRPAEPAPVVEVTPPVAGAPSRPAARPAAAHHVAATPKHPAPSGKPETSAPATAAPAPAPSPAKPAPHSNDSLFDDRQ